LELVDDDELLSPEVVAPLLDDGLEEELGEAVLLEELSLGVLAPEPMLPLLEGELVEGELVEGELVSDDELPVPLAPDAPEELSPDELGLALLLAPPLAPPPAPAPAPCAHAAPAKATMAAVTAALMSFRFIFSSSRVGRGITAPEGDARTMPEAFSRKLCVRSRANEPSNLFAGVRFLSGEIHSLISTSGSFGEHSHGDEKTQGGEEAADQRGAEESDLGSSRPERGRSGALRGMERRARGVRGRRA
jgi:hypothetical protein